MTPRRLAAAALAAVTLAASTLAWWALSPRDDHSHEPLDLPHAEPGSRPDIVLITVDTLRRDHLSVYGHGRETSPFLDRLADEGLRFDQAYSTSSWTLPSVASMLSSSWPGQHGATRVHTDWQGKISGQPPLVDSLPSLPEELRRLGYHTVGVTANIHLGARFGFDRGFDRYADLGFVGAPKVRAALEGLLPELHDGPPLFLWVHLFDPHAPYRRRPAFAEYAPPGALLSEGALMDQDLRHADPARRPRLTAEALAAYDSEVLFVDELVRDLFAMLPRAHEALTLITADHGEELGEHGDFGHPPTLRQTLVHLPMILHWPASGRRGVIDAPVSLVDVLPTLITAAGGEVPAGAVGVDLLAALDPARPVFLEVERGRSRAAVLRDGFKYVLALKQDRASLFDLRTDPAERADIKAADLTRATDLDALLRGHLEALVPVTSQPVSVDEAHVEQLRALGYAE